MSEWFDNQRKPTSNFRQLVQERIDKANPRRILTAEEVKTKDLLGRDFRSTKNYIVKLFVKLPILMEKRQVLPLTFKINSDV